jgi:hypothetical protein
MRGLVAAGFAAFVALSLLTSLASAQGSSTGPGDSADRTPLGSVPGSRWSRGTNRWFIASRLDIGFFFLRPRLSAGFGKPHYSWVGVDATPILSTSAVGGYTGVRAEGKYFEARTGTLYQYSFNRSYLPAAPSYGRRDIDVLEGPRAQYWMWDSELELYLPLGAVRLRSQTQTVFAGGMPDDHYLYVDTLWVVAGPGMTVRQQIGIEFFLRGTNIGITPAAEFLWLDARNTSVVRVGAQLRWLLSDEFEVRTTILPVVYSLDHLGRASGDVLEIALRWRWASK